MLMDVLDTIKVNQLKIDLAIMRQYMQKIWGWVTETERCISDIEDTLNPFLPKVNTCGGKLNRLEDKVDDLENRLHRNNLRLVCLPVEVTDSVAFLESWLEQEFG